MVEYALILVLIAEVVIVVLTVVGQQVSNVFSNVSTGLRDRRRITLTKPYRNLVQFALSCCIRGS